MDVSNTPWLSTLERDGFARVPAAFDPSELDPLSAAFEAISTRRGGNRLALERPEVWRFVRTPRFRALVEPVLGAGTFAVRGLLFDKTPLANWNLALHQDLAIAVREQRAAPGFGPWNRKDGVLHTLAPSLILEGMIAVRVHLDRTDLENGPLRVIAGSHRRRLGDSELECLAPADAIPCLAERGDALLMRPLLVHASSKAQHVSHRRVLHIELTAAELPDGLEWHDRA